MSAHLAKTKPRLMNALPAAIEVPGKLPACPRLTLASTPGELLFYGVHSQLLASRPFTELYSLYEEYLTANSVDDFLKRRQMEVTAKVFAAALPYLVIISDESCPKCSGHSFITKSATRSAISYPDGFYVDYACAQKHCDFMVRGNGTHCVDCTCNAAVCGYRRSLRIKSYTNAKPITKAEPNTKHDIQKYLLAVIEAYVPENKSRVIHQYANGEISIKRAEELTGISLSR